MDALHGDDDAPPSEIIVGWACLAALQICSCAPSPSSLGHRIQRSRSLPILLVAARRLLDLAPELIIPAPAGVTLVRRKPWPGLSEPQALLAAQTYKRPALASGAAPAAALSPKVLPTNP